MYKTQPLSPESIKTNRTISIALSLISLLMYSSPFHTLLTHGASEFGVGSWALIIFGTIFAAAAILVFNTKVELTPEAVKEKEKEMQKDSDEFWSKWYIRYPGAIFMLFIAYLSFIHYTSYPHNIRLPAMALLLINPISGSIAVIIAIFSAWELSLFVIAV